MNTDPHGLPIHVDLADPRPSIIEPPLTHAVYVECVVCARRSESLPVSLTTGVCTRCEPVARATYVKKENH